MMIIRYSLMVVGVLMQIGCASMSIEQTLADGSAVKARLTLLGTDADMIEADLGAGRFAAAGVNQSEGLRHVGRAVTGVATVWGLTTVAVEQARGEASAAAGREATEQARIGADAATRQTETREAARAAMSLGHNEEANVGAINAVTGGLVR
jgi:hypothetical protein